MSIGALFRKTFSHGVHPDEQKELTARSAIVRLPFPKRVIVPLAQHIGAPAVPLVRKGEEVVRGQPIARASGFLSVPHHAPATGVVKKLELMASAKGPKTESIVIDLHPADGQNVLYGSFQDLDSLSPTELLEAVRETGMVGLGGAAFPTHAKLSIPEGHTIHTLIINGCECEPYLSTDHRVMLEQIDELILGTELLMKIIGAPRAIIGVEDNKPDAYKKIAARLPADGPISIEMLRTKYPQGAEKMLIKSLLGSEVPSGGFPFQVGVVVQNVATVAQLGELMPRGQGLIERVITVTGPGISKPGNYRVALGTPLRFVMEQVGYTGSAGELIMGGPMMGMSVASLDVPITKAVSAILVLDQPSRVARQADRTYPCIKCGRCLDACPIHLNPSQLGLLAAKRLYDVMEESYHLNDCFECGSCSYVCPAAIPLVQYFRIAKAINRETHQREAAENAG